MAIAPCHHHVSHRFPPEQASDLRERTVLAVIVSEGRISPAIPGHVDTSQLTHLPHVGRLRVPPSFFGISLGLVGLAEAWHAAEAPLGTSSIIPDAINVLAAVVWVLLTVGYLAQGPRRLLADLSDPVLAPFVSLSAITGMLLAGALSAFAFGAGRVLVGVFLVLTVLAGGWLTGQWILSDTAEAFFHPGYFLPTVAGGLVGAFCAAQVHLHAVGYASFGIGIICWFLVGSVLLNRLFFRPGLPAPLVPTLAIELAPPAVAGIALFALNGPVASPLACALGGYTVLMALVQLRFVPVYVRLPFSPGFWAFTFSYAAAATDALLWISVKEPGGSPIYAACIVAAITILILVISARTVHLLLRGRLFPAQPLRADYSADSSQLPVVEANGSVAPVRVPESTQPLQGAAHA
jgi:tellurite resistance protein